MSNKIWLTEEDILDDLEQVTGSRLSHIDERFAVRGERPPPVSVPDGDEDEFIQMYGHYANRNSTIEKPDLSGITHMLMMVNDYYDSARHDDDKNIKELKKATDSVIRISKLDPTVAEFVPQRIEMAESRREIKNLVENGQSSQSESPDCFGASESNSKSLDIKHLVHKSDNAMNKTEASHNNETNINDIDVTKKIDVSSLNSNEIKDIREKLKLKIIGTSKVESLNKKRERNLAMASLLRLHTDIPNAVNKNPPLKLMTPEYFESLPADVPNNNVETEAEEEIVKVEIKKETIDNDSNEVTTSTDPIIESSSSPKTTSHESDLSSSKTCDPNVEELRNDLFMSKEMAESVKKVDKWLNGPEKKKHKSRAVFFGPVTFKRKDNGSGNSSETPVSAVDNIERPSSVQTTDSFIPSAYASDLTQSYTERSQRMSVKNEDIFTKLVRELKEKDKAIKERLLATATQN